MTKRQDEAQAVFPYDGTHGAFVNGSDLVRRFAETMSSDMPPYIAYSPQQTGRGYRSAAWRVVRPGFKTDPGAHWQDQNNKTFNCYTRDDKAPQLEAAKAWCAQQYGITEWKKTNRLRAAGDWFPAVVVDWLEETIKEHQRTVTTGGRS